MKKKNFAASPAHASRSRTSMPSDRRVSIRIPLRTLLAAGLCGAALSASAVHTYDALGRLASTVYSNGSSTTTITYSYDPGGNRTSVVTTTP